MGKIKGRKDCFFHGSLLTIKEVLESENSRAFYSTSHFQHSVRVLCETYKDQIPLLPFICLIKKILVSILFIPYIQFN